MLLVAAVVAFGWKTRVEGHRMVTNPRETRKVATETPAARELAFEDAQRDDVGWAAPERLVRPGAERDTVMLVHGYKDQRGAMLGVAEVLHRHGYSVLVASLRGHDTNDGELISFGLFEVRDLAAWDEYLQRPRGRGSGARGAVRRLDGRIDQPPVRIGPSGHPHGDCRQRVLVRVRHGGHEHQVLHGPAAVSLCAGDRVLGRARDRRAACRCSMRRSGSRQISPRPVFLMQGGADTVVSRRKRHASCSTPPASPRNSGSSRPSAHAQFLKMMPEQFEARVTAFLDRYLKP